MKIPHQTCCVAIRVGTRTARIASCLPRRGWSLHSKGYLIYTSRGKAHGIKRGARAHVLAIELLQHARLAPGDRVHHQDFDKLNCCPLNLIKTQGDALNPSPVKRDPYTGVFLSPADWDRRYGVLKEIREYAEESESLMPDWVTHDWSIAEERARVE